MNLSMNDMRRSKYLLALERKRLSTLVQVLTGHCLIGEHAKRLGIDSNDFCRSCGDEEEVESIEHLLCDCPALSKRRLDILGSAFLGSLTDLSSTDIRTIDKFIYQTGWFHSFTITKKPINKQTQRKQKPRKNASVARNRMNGIKSAKRASMKLEDLRRLRERQAEEKRKYRSKMPQDQLEAMRERDRIRKRQMRMGLTSISLTTTDMKKKSVKVRDQTNIRDIKALEKRIYRSKLAEEQINAVRERDRIRKRLARSKAMVPAVKKENANKKKPSARSKDVVAVKKEIPNKNKSQHTNSIVKKEDKQTTKPLKAKTPSKAKKQSTSSATDDDISDRKSPSVKENKIFLKFWKINKIARKNV